MRLSYSTVPMTALQVQQPKHVHLICLMSLTTLMSSCGACASLVQLMWSACTSGTAHVQCAPEVQQLERVHLWYSSCGARAPHEPHPHELMQSRRSSLGCSITNNLDTAAVKNRNGTNQKTWVDLGTTDLVRWLGPDKNCCNDLDLTGLQQTMWGWRVCCKDLI
uniref:Uncharacterized protein n=1 Tax=Dunaliella tertiolecta TaxID=3047 RepID=A0A7S3QLF9_DUNTE